MPACYCCLTHHPSDKTLCTCSGGTCRRHAPLCREHCDCGPVDETDAFQMLNDPDGPFGDLPRLRWATEQATPETPGRVGQGIV